MSRIKVDRITDKAGTGAPILVNGMNVTGKSTMGDIVGAAVTFNSITGGSANFSSDVSIGGTLTYEDVTNIDSVGLITARDGIKVTSGNVDISTGKLGVGNASPTFKLDVVSSDTNTASFKGRIIRFDGAAATDSPRLNLSLDGTDKAQVLLHRTTDDLDITTLTASDIVLKTNSSERLRIGPVGQLGLSGANYGTSGQVLTSQGSGAAVQWATPAGGSWEVVSTQVLSGSATYLDFNNWSNAYQKYQLVFNDVYYNHTNFRIWLRIYKDATSGNTGTLKTQSNGYISNSSTMNLTTSGISAAWSGWIDYHKLGNNHQGPKWDGTYTFYMGQPTSTPSGNNECTWIGQSIRERDISPTDAGGYVADQSQYLTGIRLYFIENSSDACSPTAGRFTLYRMKYS